MPFKDKKRYNRYMSDYMKTYRAEQRMLAKEMVKLLREQKSPLLKELKFGSRTARRRKR